MKKVDNALKIKNVLYILISILYCLLIPLAKLHRGFMFISYIASCLLTILYIWLNTFIRETLTDDIRCRTQQSFLYNKPYYHGILIYSLKTMDNNLKWKYSNSDIGVVLSSIVISITLCIYELVEFGKNVSFYFILFYAYILGKSIIKFLDSDSDLIIAMDIKGEKVKYGTEN